MVYENGCQSTNHLVGWCWSKAKQNNGGAPEIAQCEQFAEILIGGQDDRPFSLSHFENLRVQSSRIDIVDVQSLMAYLF